MIYLIIHFLFWPLIGLFILMCVSITHDLTKNSEKNKAEFEMQKLQEKNNHELQQAYAEIKMTQQKASETFINIQKIKENTELKLQQVLRENMKLKNELNGARQRSKRIAKKLKSGV